jgi:outer membrane protein assembly factor BamE (lipoprotein component of BamABCDE complex)
MNMKLASLVLVVLLAFTFSCAPSILEGRKIDADKVKQIQPGTTDVNKLVGLLGTPTKTEKTSEGDLMYIYTYTTGNPHWWTVDKTQGQNLEVVLKNGVVNTYKFRQEGQEAVLTQ